MTAVLQAANVLTPDPMGPGWVAFAEGRVVDIGTGSRAGAVDLGEVTLVPGFVDMHNHGGGGAAFTDGPDAARVAIATHLAHGTTSLMASLVTDTVDVLAQQVAALAPLVAADELLGVHLEGPWLSPAHCGAHQPGLLAAPTAGDIDRLVGDASVVRMVTLAVELPGGTAAVERISAAGALAALGHSDATYAQAMGAVAAGARVATHLFNAERPVHHREPGPVGALLEAPETVIELIADGVHVHPAMLHLAAQAKPHRFALITDAMAAAGAGDGDFELGPMRVVVRDGVARLASADPAEPGAIAGSTLTLDQAVRFCVTEARMSLPEAVEAATRTPADTVGRSDLGRLAPGARADVVALGADLGVAAVWRAGERVR